MTGGLLAGHLPLSARLARPVVAAAHLALAALLFSGCSATPPAKPAPRLDPALAPFLPDPSSLSRSSVAPDVARLHRRLLSGGDAGAIASESAALLEAAPGDAGARTLLAEARLAAGEAAAALGELAAIPPPAGRSSEVALVAGRAAEQVDDPVAAVSWYRLAGGAAALDRSRKLEARAAEILRNRCTDLLARGRIDEAEQALAQLEQLRPSDSASLELARSVAVARADPRRELAALRALAPAHPDDLELQLRRGELEVEVGEARVGLELLADLAVRRPADAQVAAELERAKLVFRLANAPETVRASAGRAQLSRADFARLLFWLVPDVRSARGGAPRIASDILDHPAREEIVRVVNLGLLGVDEVRHLFEPDRPIRRVEALRALLVDPFAGGRWRPCTGAASGDVCAAAQACGLLGEAGECLPSAPLSGREAVDWIRRIPEAPGAAR